MASNDKLRERISAAVRSWDGDNLINQPEVDDLINHLTVALSAPGDVGEAGADLESASAWLQRLARYPTVVHRGQGPRIKYEATLTREENDRLQVALRLPAPAVDGSSGVREGGGVDLKYGRVTTERAIFGDGEPLFILRGNDATAWDAISAYRHLCERAGASPEHLAGIDAAQDRFTDWRAERPTKVPDTPSEVSDGPAPAPSGVPEGPDAESFWRHWAADAATSIKKAWNPCPGPQRAEGRREEVRAAAESVLLRRSPFVDFADIPASGASEAVEGGEAAAKWEPAPECHGYPGSEKLRYHDAWYHLVQPYEGRFRVVGGPAGTVLGLEADTMSEAKGLAEAHAVRCAEADRDRSRRDAAQADRVLGARAATPVSESRTGGGEPVVRVEDVETMLANTSRYFAGDHVNAGVVLAEVGRRLREAAPPAPASTPDAEGGERYACNACSYTTTREEWGSLRLQNECPVCPEGFLRTPAESRAERQEAGAEVEHQWCLICGGRYPAEARVDGCPLCGYGGSYCARNGHNWYLGRDLREHCRRCNQSREVPGAPAPVSSLDAGDGEAAALEEDPEWFSSPKDAVIGWAMGAPATPPAGDGGEPEEQQR